MYNYDEIATKIKKQAKSQNITLKTMLTDLDLGINLISQLSKGSNITAINLAKIADYLGCSVDFLLGRDAGTQEKSPGTEDSMPGDEDGFEERALRLMRAASRLSDGQRDFLLEILELAAERMPRETPQTERNLPETKSAVVTAIPANVHNNP